MPRDKEKKEGGLKGTGILIIILMITTFLSVMALLIKCDVGGFGTSIRPALKNIPVIKWILPAASDEEVAIENDYPYDTLEEALAQIAVLDAANASKDAEIVSLNDRVVELEAEVTRLSAYEAAQIEFEQEKSEFYDVIVYGESAPETDIY